MCKAREIVKERIEKLCQERGLSRYGLSHQTGVPLSTLMHMMEGEIDNPGIMTIVKICNGLEISLAEFFDTPEFEKLVAEANKE